MGLLTPRAAADRLGVSYSAFKQWIYKGLLRTTVTGGGHHRVAEAEVTRLMASHGQQPPPAKRGRRQRSGVVVAISGRNQLHGIVEEVRTDGLLAQIRLRIGTERLTAVITREAVEELGLKRGQAALAVIKSTEVMIAREPD
jgi:molybdopterin-binding protein